MKIGSSLYFFNNKYSVIKGIRAAFKKNLKCCDDNTIITR